MNYGAKIQAVLSHIGENPRLFSRGDWFLTSFSKGDRLPDYVFRVECIDVNENAVLFVCIDTITKGICFHYLDSSPDPDVERWGNTFFLLHCCVTRGIEPIYRNWLDSHGYSLAPKPMELEEKPWLIETIIGWKHHEE